MTALPSQPQVSAPFRAGRFNLATLFGLLILVGLVYLPGLSGGFVFDDYSNIVDAKALHVDWKSSWSEWLAACFSSSSSELQRPLAMLTFAVNHAFTGLDPYWMKLTNLLIHLLNSCLVYGICQQLFRVSNSCAPSALDNHSVRGQWSALWCTAAWALNPINVMAVLFVVQRMESLSHTFVLSGLWMYLSGRMRLQAGEGGGWALLLAGVLGGTVLGILVKESAALLPMYALATEWALLGFSTNHRVRDWRLIALFGIVLLLPAVLGLAWMLPRVLSPDAYATRNFDLGERLLTESRVLVDYLHWTLLPDLSQLSLYHDAYPVSHGLLDPPSTLWSILVLAALISTTLRLRKGHPLMALGLVWFFCAHLLTATIWPLELVYEHRNYFASFGLCLALGALLLWAPWTRAHRRISITVSLAILMLYASTTMLRALEWSNPLRFALSEATKHPASPRASYDLARNYIILSKLEPASDYIDEAFAALAHAQGVPGATPLPEAAAITLAARSGRRIEPAWWASLRHKLDSAPIGVEGLNALGTLARCLPDIGCRLPPDQMISTFRIALKNDRHPEALNIYAIYALDGLHDPDLALSLWREATGRAPDVVQYQENLARMLIALGRPDLAEEPITRIRELGRWGQNEPIARELERMARRQQAIR